MAKFFSARALVILGIGGVAIATSLTAAVAVTDTAFNYATPKTGYFAISNMAMVPKDSVAADNYDNSAGGGLQSGGTSQCFNTGVNLPNGATVDLLSIWYQSAGTSNPAVTLLRVNNETGAFNFLISAPINNDSDTRLQRNFPITSAARVIDNPRYTYGFHVCLGGSDTFYSARIRYTYTNAGD